MTRISKQAERRQVSFRKHRKPSVKTGPRKDNLSLGYVPHANALEGSALAEAAFVPKVKKV